jgi:hypothetical protein
MELYQFIAEEFFGNEKKLNVFLKDKVIHVEADNWQYNEAFFDEQAMFTEKDNSSLLYIFNYISESRNLVHIQHTEVNFLRLFYLITHEKYFIENPPLDKHGRISSLSLKDEFKTILQVPICDILKQIAYIKFGLEWKREKKLILTCDYDIMNIWDIYEKKDFLKLILRCLKSFDIKKLTYYIYSYFFSRKLASANGYLNIKMFETKLDCERIAFLISKSENKEIDCNANYKDKPVVEFIKELKNSGIELGLHANYNTMKNVDSIPAQINAFTSKISPITPQYNRHHYLRYHFPSYLNQFEGTSIKKDFSIYFAESLLFRCGISSEFKVWNEFSQSPYKTSIIPTTLMDVTFTDYLSLDEDKAFDYAVKKIKLATLYGDGVVLLWHNGNTFSRSVNYSYHLSLFDRIIKFIESLDLPIEKKK